MAASTSAATADLALARRVRIEAARVDFASFVELVLEDEAGGSVELAPFQLEWCALLDAHPRLALLAAIEHGKSSIACVARVLWTLGRDPSSRVALVSNTATMARKTLAVVARYIERSARLREVFPALVPDHNASWRADAITIVRSTYSRDPSVQAVGVHGALLGSRLDFAVLDDTEDFESSRTPDQRATTAGWVRSTVLTRLVHGGRVVALGAAWHSEDLLHTLERDGWLTFRYGVQDADGRPRWPQRWPLDRIAAKRIELGRRAAANQLDVVPLAEGGRIDPAWVDAALARGERRHLLGHGGYSLPEGAMFVAGVDLAVGQTDRHDRTAIVVLLLHPNPNQHRELVAIESGRWDAPTIVNRIMSINARFGPRAIVVESNAAQMYIVQMSRALGDVPVRPFTTGRGAKSIPFAVDALAVELERSQWTIRGKSDPEVEQLARDITYYDPRAHCPDRLAALVMARHAAAQHASRVEFPNVDFSRR